MPHPTPATIVIHMPRIASPHQPFQPSINHGSVWVLKRTQSIPLALGNPAPTHSSKHTRYLHVYMLSMQLNIHAQGPQGPLSSPRPQGPRPQGPWPNGPGLHGPKPKGFGPRPKRPNSPIPRLPNSPTPRLPDSPTPLTPRLPNPIGPSGPLNIYTSSRSIASLALLAIAHGRNVELWGS